MSKSYGTEKPRQPTQGGLLTLHLTPQTLALRVVELVIAAFAIGAGLAASVRLGDLPHERQP